MKLPLLPGHTLQRVVEESKFPCEATVLRNGFIEENLIQFVRPGDVILLVPRPHNEDTGRMIMSLAVVVLSAYTGYYVGIEMGYGMFWGAMASFAVTTAGGLMINSMFPPPAISSGQSPGGSYADSPTYGWSGAPNPIEEGRPIPVIYGNTKSLPQLINYYLSVDASGFEWAHVLLCVGEGITNNIPTSEDIYWGESVLSLFDEDYYELGTTDGSDTPTEGGVGLDNFEKLHQYRQMQRRLPGQPSYAQSLWHCDGDDDSTNLIDECYDYDWSLHGTAHMDVADPFIGNAFLNLSGAGSYTQNNTMAGIDRWNLSKHSIWDIETRFRQPTLMDSGICAQRFRADFWPDEYTMEEVGWIWSCMYKHSSEQLVFQMYSYVGEWLVSVSVTLYYNIAIDIPGGLTEDYWNHIRFSCNDYYVRIYLDGTLLGGGSYLLKPPDFRDNNYQKLVYTGAGTGYYYDGADVTPWDGRCQLDEFRLAAGNNLYELASFTPPTEPLGYGLVQDFQTKGHCDELSFIIEATYGLYEMDVDGNLVNRSVDATIAFKLQEEIEEEYWHYRQVTITGATRYPKKAIFNQVLPARGKYDIMIYRSSSESQGTRVQDRIYLTSMDEILHEDLLYPGLQLVALSMRAQDETSGSMQPVRVVNNRSLITVPHYGDVDPSNNAYAAFDMLTNTNYGGGVNYSRFDLVNWDAWVDWCDYEFSDGKRCQFNMTMDVLQSMDEAIQHVENTGRSKIIMRGTEISVVTEKPGSPSGLFCDANTVKDSTRTKYLPQEERSDALQLQFTNKENSWQTETVLATCSNYNTLSRVPYIVKMSFPGINNRGQAMREAILRQQLSENIKRSVEFQTGIEGIPSMVGDIIRYRQEGDEMTFDGRLKSSVSSGTIYLDKIINLDSTLFSGSCKMWIRKQDDSVVELNVSGPLDEDTEILYADNTSELSRFDPFIIGRPTESIYLYRMISISRTSLQELSVTGLHYVESSYYHADYGSGLVPI